MDTEKASRVYFDTFVFMDMLSGNPDAAKKAEGYVRNNRGVVSSILLTEIAFHVARRKKSKLAEVLFSVQSLPQLEIVPVDSEIAQLAGRLRAKYRGKTEKKLTYFDCIHLATAMRTGCMKFITGDKGFHEIEDIEMEIYQ